MWWWRKIKVTQQLLFWKTALFTILLQCLEGHSLSQFLNNHSEKYKLIIVFSIRPPDALQMWDLKTSGPIGSFFEVIQFEAIMFSKSLHQNTQMCHISLKVWLITRFQYQLISQHEKSDKKWETWQPSKKTDWLTLYQAGGCLRYLLPTISKVYFRWGFFFLTAIFLVGLQEECWGISQLHELPAHCRALCTLLKGTSAVIWRCLGTSSATSTSSNFCPKPRLEPRTLCTQPSLAAFAVCGNDNTSLFLMKPETKEHYIHQQSHKSPLFFAETTKFNNLQSNCCSCLFLTICHYCALCKFKNLGQHNVSWTNCSMTTALNTT